MKKNLFRLTAIAVLFPTLFVTTACDKDTPVVAILTTDAPATIEFNADGTGGVSVITVTTDQPAWDFTLSPAEGWLTATASGDKLNLVAAPTTSKEAPAPVVLTITAGNAAVVITVTQKAYVPVPEVAFEIAGLAGEVEVKYTDGSSESATITDGKVSVDFTEAKTVYSISSTTTGEVLIGRALDVANPIELKFDGGALAFRDAVDGATPVGTYAEFAKINEEESVFGWGGTAKSYFQEADIDLLGAESLTTAGLTRQNWIPIGYYDTTNEMMEEWNGFVGIFDGKGHSISNIYIDSDNKGRSFGLFGLLDKEGVLSNIHIVSGSIEAVRYVGSISGSMAWDSRIINCSNAASVTGVGGKYAEGMSLIGGVGGICGNVDASYIIGCKNTGNVSAETLVGGIAGYAFGWTMDPRIQKSVNTGNVTGTTKVGGITGQTEHSLTANYSTGLVSGSGNWIGGISGATPGDPAVENNYWLKYTTGAESGYTGVEWDQVEVPVRPSDTGAEPFSATAWPTSSLNGWNVGEGGWASLGAWAAGGSPAGSGSVFPKLFWE
jgi:hypothetical protein